MIDEEAHRQAEAVPLGMDITIYVVPSREGDFRPVQQPPEDRVGWQFDSGDVR